MRCVESDFIPGLHGGLAASRYPGISHRSGNPGMSRYMSGFGRVSLSRCHHGVRRASWNPCAIKGRPVSGGVTHLARLQSLCGGRQVATTGAGALGLVYCHVRYFPVAIATRRPAPARASGCLRIRFRGSRAFVRGSILTTTVREQPHRRPHPMWPGSHKAWESRPTRGAANAAGCEPEVGFEVAIDVQSESRV